VLRVYDISGQRASDKEDTLERVLFEDRYGGVFPLGCAFFDNGSLSVVTDGTISVYNKKYAPESEIGFTDEMSAFSVDSPGAAIALRSGALNNKNRVIAFDQSGELMFDGTVSSSADGIGVSGRYLFLKSTRGVLRVDTKDSSEKYVESQTGKLMVYDDETAIVCGESTASYIKF
jgi:hypothetical protein